MAGRTGGRDEKDVEEANAIIGEKVPLFAVVDSQGIGNANAKSDAFQVFTKSARNDDIGISNSSLPCPASCSTQAEEGQANAQECP